MKIVAVTSCPTGIAHTYMAAEALEGAGRDAGHEIAVETQGSAGAVPLDPAVIAAADAVIFAADVEVRDRQRFAGKPTVTVSVKHAINHAAEVIGDAEAAAASAPAPDPHVAAAAAPVARVSGQMGKGTMVRGWLMTGVSYLIPFVAAGGILIALSFMLARIAEGDAGYRIVEVDADVPAFIDQFSVLQPARLGRSDVHHRCGHVRLPQRRSSPATSRTRSPTGLVSHLASSPAGQQAAWAPDSSVPSSAASPVV